jgi:hypothetical protein
MKIIIKLLLLVLTSTLLVQCNNSKENSKKSAQFPVKAGNNWAFIDTTCTYVVEPKFEGASDFFCGRALITRSNKIAYINQYGEIKSSFTYTNGTDFSENFAFVLDSLNIISCIDTSMKVQFVLKEIEEVHSFNEGFAAFRKEGKFGFINLKGNVVIPCIYDAALDFSEGVCGVANLIGTEDSTYYDWFFIDKTGKKIINQNFEEVNEFKMGLSAVKLNGKFGWIDRSGKFIYGNEFEECKSFSEGFARFTLNGAWGLINRLGKIVVEPSFMAIGDMHEGLAMISLGPGNSTGYIDSTGKIVIKPIYQSASFFKNGYAYVAKNNRISVINKSGKLYCDEQFESVPGFLGADLGFLNFSMNSRLEINVDTVSTINLK